MKSQESHELVGIPMCFSNSRLACLVALTANLIAGSLQEGRERYARIMTEILWPHWNRLGSFSIVCMYLQLLIGFYETAILMNEAVLISLSLVVFHIDTLSGSIYTSLSIYYPVPIEPLYPIST